MACSGRHHRWKIYPPVAGTACANCERIYGTAAKDAPVGGGAVVAASPSEVKAVPLPEAAPPPSGARSRPSIAEMFRTVTPAAPTSPAAPLAPPPPPLPPGWTKVIGPRLARVALMGTAKLAEYSTKEDKKYEAGELDDDTEELVEDSFSNALAHWFPDAALGPGKQLMVALAFAFGEQWIGRTEIEADADATDAAPSTKPAATRPPAPAAAARPIPAAPPAPTEDMGPFHGTADPAEAFDDA